MYKGYELELLVTKIAVLDNYEQDLFLRLEKKTLAICKVIVGELSAQYQTYLFNGE